MKVLAVLGTRPEAIKLATVVRRFREHPLEFDIRVVATAQHRGLLDQALAAFALTVDYDLNLMRPAQTLAGSDASVFDGLDPILASERPDLLLVQGDTTTAFCGTLAAFYHGIPVGHLEAGLRTGDFAQPFPEEMHRVLAGRLATLHFAPTSWAAENLYREGVPRECVFVTGNTGIDAVLETLGSSPLASFGNLDPRKKLILVTSHRRENFGAGLAGICAALQQLALRNDVEIVFPLHPNPQVRQAVAHLSSTPHIHLIEPLDYAAFVAMMQRAAILLTDSGGVQEEGPSLGKPVLVLRDKTERPEAVEAGTSRLVGTDAPRIVAEATLLLDDAAEYQRRAHIANPYGDGRASARIVDIVRSYFATRYACQPTPHSASAHL